MHKEGEMKITLKKLLGYVAGLLAVVALFLPLAAALVYRKPVGNGEIVTTYTNLYGFIFGGEVTTQGASISGTGDLKGAVALPLVAWILLVLGTIGTLVGISFGCMKKARLANLAFLGTALVLIVSAVLFFASKSALLTAVVGETLAENMAADTALGFGAIGTGIFAIVSAVSCVGSAILKK